MPTSSIESRLQLRKVLDEFQDWSLERWEEEKPPYDLALAARLIGDTPQQEHNLYRPSDWDAELQQFFPLLANHLLDTFPYITAMQAGYAVAYSGAMPLIVVHIEPDRYQTVEVDDALIAPVVPKDREDEQRIQADPVAQAAGIGIDFLRPNDTFGYWEFGPDEEPPTFDEWLSKFTPSVRDPESLRGEYEMAMRGESIHAALNGDAWLQLYRMPFVYRRRWPVLAEAYPEICRFVAYETRWGRVSDAIDWAAQRYGFKTTLSRRVSASPTSRGISLKIPRGMFKRIPFDFPLPPDLPF